MMNQVFIVGRIASMEEQKEKKGLNLVLAVPRSYKNEEGLYDTDFIDVSIWDNIASNVMEYCNKGDLVGIKGRIQTENYETENGEKKKATKIIAEKVTFLSSKKNEG